MGIPGERRNLVLDADAEAIQQPCEAPGTGADPCVISPGDRAVAEAGDDFPIAVTAGRMIDDRRNEERRFLHQTQHSASRMGRSLTVVRSRFSVSGDRVYFPAFAVVTSTIPEKAETPSSAMSVIGPFSLLYPSVRARSMWRGSPVMSFATSRT